MSDTACDKTSFLATPSFFLPILPPDDICSVEARTFFEWSGTAARREVLPFFEVLGPDSAERGERGRLVDDMVVPYVCATQCVYTCTGLSHVYMCTKSVYIRDFF